MADNRISLFRFQKLLGSKVPMLETIEEETETEKTMEFGSETKKVGDENRKDDQKMLNIASMLGVLRGWRIFQEKWRVLKKRLFITKVKKLFRSTRAKAAIKTMMAKERAAPMR